MSHRRLRSAVSCSLCVSERSTSVYPHSLAPTWLSVFFPHPRGPSSSTCPPACPSATVMLAMLSA
eukprot:658625-Hanusia_phi.AAC.5